MKICYDNLGRFEYIEQNIWRERVKRGTRLYIYRDKCETCGEPYLTRKCQISNFCSISCARKNKELSDEHKKHLSKTKIGKKGDKSNGWRGGVMELNIPLFSTYASQISYAEEVRRDPENSDWLQVQCAYCGKWFTPTRCSVSHRAGCLNGSMSGESRFYCSDNCKLACPIYNKHYYPAGFKHTTSREVDPYLRQMVLERDDWTCQICGKTVEEAELHCHHMDPAAQNPMFQNDMDGCVTLCKDCHGWVHTQHGCKYVDLRCS